MKRAGKKVSRKSGLASSSVTPPQLEAIWLALAPESFTTQNQIAQKLASMTGMPNAQISWLQSPPSEGVQTRELLLILPKGKVISNAKGWEATRALRGAQGVSDAEPLFRTTGLEAEPNALAPHERKPIAKSGGSDKPLPCAGNNCIWHLKEINATEAWLLLPPPGGQRYGKGIVVGHPDTGYTKHFEIWPQDGIPPRVKPELGYNYEEGRPDPLDPMTGSNPGHGTSTASVIMSSAGGPNAMFVTGAAPEAEIVPFRVKDSVIHFSFKNLIQAIYRAVDSAGVHVISMSLGGPLKSKALKSAIDYAISKGVIIVAAAGNRYPWTVYPAGYDSVIALAATNCARKPWGGSTSGSQVDLSAPGESVWRAYSHVKGKTLKFDVEPSSGSSYATALTAGAAATWLAYWGRSNLISRYGAGRIQAVFASLLKSVGHDVPEGWDSANYGVGILEMRKLLEAPLPPASKSKKFLVSELSGVDFPHYFPDIKPARVNSEIANLVGQQPTAKSKSVSDDVDLEELAFQVATNPQLRSELHKQMTGPIPKGVQSVGNGAKAAALLVDASPSLIARLTPN
jgi:serine protease